VGESRKRTEADAEEAKVLPAREALSLISGGGSGGDDDDETSEESDGPGEADVDRAPAEPPPET
jgi:hypothetical protein